MGNTKRKTRERGLSLEAFENIVPSKGKLENDQSFESFIGEVYWQILQNLRAT